MTGPAKSAEFVSSSEDEGSTFERSFMVDKENVGHQNAPIVPARSSTQTPTSDHRLSDVQQQINKAFSSGNQEQLNQIIKELGTNMTTTLFESYQESVAERLQRGDELIAELGKENDDLRNDLVTAEATIAQLRAELAREKDDADNIKRDVTEKSKETQSGFTAQIVGLEEKVQTLNESLELYCDFIEHLCDIRIHSMNEDPQGVWFDISQGGKYGVVDYRLGFVKEDKDEELAEQVLYVPLLKSRSSQEIVDLQKRLPDYFFDSLNFPLDTLVSFYTKMQKALNKEVYSDAMQ